MKERFLAVLGGCTAVVISSLIAWWSIPPAPSAEFAEIDYGGKTQHNIQVPDASNIDFRPQLISDTTGSFVHAATVTELASGKLLAAWFSGSREGATDVEIVASQYHPDTQSWGSNYTLFTPKQTQSQLDRYIKKVGNPVLTTLKNGRVWIFYVTVSIGGWAGSAINAAYSDDEGVTWSPVKRLITSPFFNLSTLVKTRPILYADGSIGLPVYHEFIGKFAELLRLSPEGDVLEKSRIHYGDESLQPVILPKNKLQATTLMRYAGEGSGRVLISRTADAGHNWSPVQKTVLPNPNSALAALRLKDNSLIAVLNDLEAERHRLSLYHSRDEGISWQKLFVFEDSTKWGDTHFTRETFAPALRSEFFASVGVQRRSLAENYLKRLDKRVCKDNNCRFIYDYPYLIRSSEGDFHLLYTWNKSFIKHIRFNPAWLESLI